MLAGKARGKAFQELPNLVRFTKAWRIEFFNKNTEPVDRFDKAEPLQLKQRFPHRSLGHAEFLGQALLREPFARLRLARQDAALDLFSNLVPTNRRLHHHTRQLLRILSLKTVRWPTGLSFANFGSRDAIRSNH